MPRRPLLLVVEDDAVLRELFRVALSLSNFAVHACEDGLDALHYLDQARPDVIVLDLDLPRVSGTVLYEEMRARRRADRVPIIVVTGLAKVPDLPGATILRKPVTPAGDRGKPREEKKEEDRRPAAPSRDREPSERKLPTAPKKPGEEEEVEVDAEPPESLEVAMPPTPPPARRKKDVPGLRKGLKKMRDSGGLFGRLKELFVGKKEIDPKLVDQIEEILITSDVGAKTTEMLLADIKEGLAKKELEDSDKVWAALRKRAKELLDLPGGGALRDHGKPTVVLLVGVNGTGKTTTIGKLATKLGEQGKKVLLVAGDTFRAAAVQQLQAWGKRTGCEVFSSKEGADPASVVFDAIAHATESRFDIVLCDTAGRLHTKSNLMDELKKVHRTAQKALEGAPHETLLVVDGTTGQNAVAQAQEFGEALQLTGIVLTKLDGTAKGGVVIAIAAEHKLPVRYVGVGERPQDLRDFDADEFVEALLGQSDDAARAA